MKKKLQRIFIKGGILSPSEMKQIISLSQELGFKSLKFGSRQDILIPVSEHQKEIISKYPNLNLEIEKNHENIVCSYVSSDIFPQTSWLNSSTYLYILELFKNSPTLKINITDPYQRLVPLFTGNLNFIASEFEDYWHLNLNLPGWTEHIDYPVLIYSWDIPKISEAIIAKHQETTDIDILFELVNQTVETNNRTIDKPLEVPFQPFPYYEGMNKMGLNEYWLGLYWRNNEYDLDFLEAFCDFCLDSRVGKICITPWKSFIVKGIHRKYKLNLEKLLGKRGINVRHSLLEMNWHLPVDDDQALELKKFIVRNFDQNDISTYGLNFAIANLPDNSTYFTSAVIEKNEAPNLVKDFKIRPTFNVLYCKNFNPNTQQYIVYAQDVDKMELPGLLMELSKMYFDKLGEATEEEKQKEELKEVKEVYQCKNCLSIYDEHYGDTLANIAPDTPFNNLPPQYTCGVCESEKEAFQLVKI